MTGAFLRHSVAVIAVAIVRHWKSIRLDLAVLFRLIRTGPARNWEALSEYRGVSVKCQFRLSGGSPSFAALVAAAAGGAVVAKKIGLLALLFLFLKKGFVVVAVALALLWRRIKGLFIKKPVETGNEIVEHKE
jgi:hypothetical protein